MSEVYGEGTCKDGMLTCDVLNDIAVGNWRTHDGRKRKKALLYTLNRSYWCRQMSAIPGRESREELEVTFSLRFEEVVCSDAGIEEGRAGLGLGTQQ